MSSRNQPPSISDVIPECNIHSFVFSNPFAPSKPWVKKVNAILSPTDRSLSPIPPHKPICYDPITSAAITHARLAQDTLRLARGIHEKYGTPCTTDALGSDSRVGPVVLVHLSNCLAWPVLVLGFIAAGWTVAMTNPGYTTSELTHIIEVCTPQVVICHPGGGGEDNVCAACATVRHDVSDLLLVYPDEDAYGVRRTRMLGERSWMSLLSDRELEVSLTGAADRTVALLIWTSGTTGKPKAAMMTHRAVIAGLILIWSGNHKYQPDERWIAIVPFYHIFGLYSHIFLAPCIGATLIIYQKQFSLESYLRLIVAHKATSLQVAPPIATALAKSPLIDEPWCSLASVEYMTSGGAPVSGEVIEQVWRRTGILVRSGYGMSELGPITGLGNITRWVDYVPYLRANGPTLLSVRTSVVDSDMRPVKEGEEGEMLINSPAQMLGYLNNPQATAEMLDEHGMIHTGDLGYFDKGGNLRITGRLKELIKYKGFQVSPTELEATISALPDVLDVAVSATYSKAEGTELPLAYIVPRNDAEMRHVTAAIASATATTAGDVQSTAKPKHITASTPKELVVLAGKVSKIVEDNCVHYKRLRGGVIFVPAITKSPSGKILRGALKNQHGVHVRTYPFSERNKL